MERSILNFKLRKKNQTEIYEGQTKGNKDIAKSIRQKKMGWADHVSKVNKIRWAYKVSFWHVYGKRSRGRQGMRRKDDFKQLLTHSHFHRIAYDRREWQRLGEAYAPL